MAFDSAAIRVVSREKPPYRGGLETHGVVHAVGLHRPVRKLDFREPQILWIAFLLELKILESFSPLVPLLVQEFSELEQIRVASAGCRAKLHLALHPAIGISPNRAKDGREVREAGRQNNAA